MRACSRRYSALSSTEYASTHATDDSQASCASCGAPLAGDQRYCLECGERRAQVSEFLRAGNPAVASPATTPPVPPTPPQRAEGSGQGNLPSLLAGVGVLLLAMGVGVLIGRSGASKQTAAPPQVITVGASGSGGSSAAEASFTGDWPSGTSGYTVQLQTLPQSGTSVAEVEKAKTSATAKGAKSVGALKSEEFASLPTGDYVIYSGVYHKRAEAQKALGSLKTKFPGAKVVRVSEAGSGKSSGSTESSSSPSGSGVGSSITKPAPASVLEGESKAHGKSYEEKSKNLPDVVETG